MASWNLTASASRALACAWVLAALLVRVVYVPYHLAVEEHAEAHLHAAAIDPGHCHAGGHAHDHADGHAHDGEPGQPPHSEEEHETELLLGRTELGAPAWVVVPVADFVAEAWLKRAPVRRQPLLRGPPLPDSWRGSVELARGPPRAV